jgi:CysZ protein
MSILAIAARAFSDVLSRPFRAILWKAVALTALLFLLLSIALQFALSYLHFEQYAWAESVLAVLAGLGLLAAFIFLASPVTAIFAGLFLDRVAELVERTHYPNDRPGTPPSAVLSFAYALRFGLTALAVNLLLLPLLLAGVGLFIMWLANAYLLSREYFEMTSLRHMSAVEARALRRSHKGRVFLAGLIPAGLAFIPFANLIVPMFSTSYFAHLFKALAQPSGLVSSAGRGTGPG